ncbi:MAG: hypothetical protein ACYDC1_18925 [Limisphaerales bacterium]
MESVHVASPGSGFAPHSDDTFPVPADDALTAALYLPLACHDVLVLELPFAWTGDTLPRLLVVAAYVVEP